MNTSAAYIPFVGHITFAARCVNKTLGIFELCFKTFQHKHHQVLAEKSPEVKREQSYSMPRAGVHGEDKQKIVFDPTERKLLLQSNCRYGGLIKWDPSQPVDTLKVVCVCPVEEIQKAESDRAAADLKYQQEQNRIKTLGEQVFKKPQQPEKKGLPRNFDDHDLIGIVPTGTFSVKHPEGLWEYYGCLRDIVDEATQDWKEDPAKDLIAGNWKKKENGVYMKTEPPVAIPAVNKMLLDRALR